MLRSKDFISIKDLNVKEIEGIFKLASALKKDKFYGEPLKGMTIALIFQKPSNRTRVSFEVGMEQFGGHAIYLGPDQIKLGVRESVSDVAKVLSRYIDGIVARTYKHEDILELAKSSTIPVVNGLSDLLHPCQGLSDIFTIKEKFSDHSSIKFVFMGDGNNVLNSLMYGAAIEGMNMHVVTPKGYEPKDEIRREVAELAKNSGAEILFSADPASAVKGANIIYTDVWISMGQEDERKKRLLAFKDFQLNSALLKKAEKDCKVMHCLPAHRGEEITDDVLDGPNSIVLDQAENRLHVQKALLYLLLTNAVNG
ncbi:MAG: ornithine carbamoyltransferase [Candidatus Omnitrophota bacterium]